MVSLTRYFSGFLPMLYFYLHLRGCGSVNADWHGRSINHCALSGSDDLGTV